MEALRAAGLERVAVTHEYDPFRGTNKEHIARRFGVTGVNVVGHKPA